MPAEGAFRATMFLSNKLKPQLTLCMKQKNQGSILKYGRLLAGLAGLALAAGQLPVKADPITNIDHFVVIYQENWSFDALYGNFPGANGLANASSVARNQLDRLSRNHAVKKGPPIGE